MAKKALLALALAALAAGAAAAQTGFRLGAGGGVYAASDFGGGGTASAGDATLSVKTPYASGGLFAFFDATWAELAAGVFGGGGIVESDYTGSYAGSFTLYNGESLSYLGLDFGALLKYPIALNSQFSAFPLLGAAYRLILSAKIDGQNLKADGDDDVLPGDFSAWWFHLGGGVDFSLTDSIFLRGAALYGIRLPNKFENDFCDILAPDAAAKTLLGHGLAVRLSVGRRF